MAVTAPVTPDQAGWPLARSRLPGGLGPARASRWRASASDPLPLLGTDGQVTVKLNLGRLATGFFMSGPVPSGLSRGYYSITQAVRLTQARSNAQL
jgi:hypothetical protein